MPWLNPTLILAALVAVLSSGGVGYLYGSSAGKAKIQQAWDKDRAAQAEALASAQEEMRIREASLQEVAAKQRKEKDREIRSLNARVDELLNSVRDRPPRSSKGGLPDDSGAGSGSCTGAELYRDDSEFLVRLAREADEIRLAYKQCVAQYEAARKLCRGDPSENSSQRDKQK